MCSTARVCLCALAIGSAASAADQVAKIASPDSFALFAGRLGGSDTRSS
jgi:hypothetical protein